MPLPSTHTLRTKLLFIALGITLTLTAFVPKVWQDDPFLAKLMSRLTTLQTGYPQEKIYLHLDKPYYASGEDIWFKAYLVHADSHSPSVLSQVLYVELITPDNNIYKTSVVKMDKGFGRGDFALPDDLPEGLYKIRAYTSWMQNFDENYFFHQSIQVWNARKNDVVSDVDITFKRQSNGDSVLAKLQLLNHQQKPYAQTAFSYTTETGRKADVYKQKTNAEGKANLRFFLPDGENRKNARLQLIIPQGDDDIRKTYALPIGAEALDLQFFPEGGNLVSGLWNNVGFKAVDVNGLSKEVQGAIYDQTGQKVADFKSLKFGMGRTGFIPDASKQYVARLTSPAGNQKDFPLPKPQPKGFILTIDNVKTPDKVRVKFYTLGFANSPETKPTGLYLVAQTRGHVFFSAKSANDHEVFQAEIPSAKFPSGIVQFTMFSNKGEPLAERIVFVNNNQQLKLSVTPDKPVYKPREKVTLRVKALDMVGKPVAGNFSMAVTDQQSITPSPNAANIVSYLLMSSDLRGYVESPSYYFNTKTPEAAQALDNLMLTQGWRRFIWTDILQSKYPQLPFKVEKGLAISGDVRRVNGQPEPYASVSLIDLKSGMFQTYTADEKGHFAYDLRSYSDTSKLVLKTGGSDKGLSGTMIVIDDNLPQAKVYPHVPYASYTVPLTKDTWAYLRRNREQFSLDKFSGKGTTLNAVEIKAQKQTQEEKVRATLRKSALYFNADATIGGAQLPQGMNIIQSLQGRVAGLQVSNGQVTMRGGGAATYLLDGMPVDAQMIQSLNPNDVEFIDILKPGASSAIYGSQGGNGIVAVYTKRGGSSSSTPADEAKRETALGMVSYKGLFYQTPRQFYVPRYDKPDPKTADIPDLRTTLYWNPIIKTDSTGQAEMSFFAADQRTTYRAVLEGLNNQGEMGHTLGSFQVK